MATGTASSGMSVARGDAQRALLHSQQISVDDDLLVGRDGGEPCDGDLCGQRLAHAPFVGLLHQRVLLCRRGARSNPPPHVDLPRNRSTQIVSAGWLPRPGVRARRIGEPRERRPQCRPRFANAGGRLVVTRRRQRDALIICSNASRTSDATRASPVAPPSHPPAPACQMKRRRRNHHASARRSADRPTARRRCACTPPSQATTAPCRRASIAAKPFRRIGQNHKTRQLHPHDCAKRNRGRCSLRKRRNHGIRHDSNNNIKHLFDSQTSP